MIVVINTFCAKWAGAPICLRYVYYNYVAHEYVWAELNLTVKCAVVHYEMRKNVVITSSWYESFIL